MSDIDSTQVPEHNRRDFLYVVTGMAGVVAAGAAAWPFIDQMRPDASTLAMASIRVDISSIEPGMAITVKWRGKPVTIRNRTEQEIKAAKEVPLEELKDPVARNENLPSDAPATDENRSVQGKEAWLIMEQVCTHLGCIPLGEQGEYGGWFCPCHGSVYDTAGRIRKGPAPENMHIPEYTFVSETTVQIG